MDYIFDILIVAVLIFFAWRGAKKGLILSLCGLASIFLAFFGAQFVSACFYGPVSNLIEPAIYRSVTGAESEESTEPGEPADDLPELLDAIRSAGLFSGFSDFLNNAVERDDLKQTGTLTAAQVLSDYLSQRIARTALFGLTFLVILLVWFLVSHALDLAFHLPVLASVNTLGGLLLGLMKAAIVSVILIWIGQLAGLVPSEPATPVLSLFTPRRLGELLNLLIV